MSLVPRLIAIADAVVTELQAEEWPSPLIVERSYRPRYELSQLRGLRVSVVPRAVRIESAARGADSAEYDVALAVQQKLETEDDEEIDPLLAIADQIGRYFRFRRLVVMPSVICTTVEHDPVYAVEHLEELRCLTSIVTLTFREVS